MLSIIQLDYKRILCNKMMLVTIGISFAFFFLLTGDFAKQMEQRSSIPIGIFDNDHTIESKAFLERVKQNDSIFVYEEEKNGLQKRLEEGSILAFFEINKGFEEKVKAGETTSLIKMSFLKENPIAMLLSDILAGDLMYDICLGKSIALYKTLGDKYSLLEENEYRTYVNHIKEKEEIQFGFRIEFLDKKQQDKDKQQDEKQQSGQEKLLKNTLIYKQVIIGLIGIVLNFLILFLVECIVNHKKEALEGRMKLIGKNRGIIFISHSLVILSIVGIYNIIAGIFVRKMDIVTNIHQMVFFLYCSCFLAIIQTILFTGIKIWTKTSVSYQLIGGITVIGLGGLGFLSIFVKSFLFLSKIIPNGWFIRNITDILLM